MKVTATFYYYSIFQLNFKYTSLSIINRILNIQDYLIKDKKINSKQIILTDKLETSSGSVKIEIETIK